MIESIFVGLVLATVSGITFIAYKHPDGFQRIYTNVLGLVTMVLISFSIFQILNIISAAVVIKHLATEMPTQPLSSIKENIDVLSQSLWYIGWAVSIFAAVFAYLFILRKLPYILDDMPSNKT